jgi:copper chaperone CopZ
MTLLSKTFLLPNMIWQVDEMEVEEILSSVPRTEQVEFDLDNHLATVKYSGPQALEEILLRLAEAGYPASNA